MVRVLNVDILRERIYAQVQIDDSIVEKYYQIGEFVFDRPNQEQEHDAQDDSDELKVEQ